MEFSTRRHRSRTTPSVFVLFVVSPPGSRDPSSFPGTHSHDHLIRLGLLLKISVLLLKKSLNLSPKVSRSFMSLL
ncbi:hypothetical protein SLA2020_336460 [Shorea laevis]